MPSRRRLRKLRHKAWWVSAQTLIQTVSISVIIAIFVFENSAVEVVKDGTIVQKDGTSDGHQAQQSKAVPHDSSDNLSTFQKVSNDESLTTSLTVIGAAVRTRDTSKTPRPVSKQGQAEKKKRQNPSINLVEFHEHVEQKAMEDAVRRKAVLRAGKKRTKQVQESKQISQDMGSFKSNEGGADSGGERFAHDPHDGSNSTSYRGVRTTAENAHLFQLENITYLTFMLYRLIKKYNITSIIDVPCTTSILWAPELVQRLEFEIPRFHYRCIVPNDEYLVEGVIRFKDTTSTVVVKDTTYWTSTLPKADLALTWYGVGYIQPRMSWQLLKTIRQSQAKYIVLATHPDVRMNPFGADEQGRANVRRPPYLFDEPFRVVKNINTTSARPKDLLLYKAAEVRKGVI